jgi:putative tricarboxylic transport membrane protein
VLPGAGASLGSFMAYSLEKRWSDKDKTFGTGDPRGVAAPEAGNNAAAGGALVPMLALGVPGSGTTAVLLAMLLALNITPGPLLFQQNPDVVWGLIAALFIGNVMLSAHEHSDGLAVRARAADPAEIPHAGGGDDLLRRHLRHFRLDLRSAGDGRLRRHRLGAAQARCAAGSRSSSACCSATRWRQNLRRAMTISDGDWTALFASPLAIGLWTFAILGFVAPILFGRYFRVKRRDEEYVGD